MKNYKYFINEATKILKDNLAKQYEIEAKATTSYPPKKTVKVYKIFRTLQTKPGKIFPLFIDKSVDTKIGRWIPALFSPTKGFAPRPGWHSGPAPYAPHLMKKDYKTMQDNRVWAECEIPNDYDWNQVLQKEGAKQLESIVPYGGFYYFNTNKVGGTNMAWRISGAVKVNKLLTLEEADKINGQFGFDSQYVKWANV